MTNTQMAFDPAALAGFTAGHAPLWLFLDYDGTLADFAPTPDDILPDPDLIDLLERLAQKDQAKVAIVSGRRLSHIQALIPTPGITLAGTYGLEMQLPQAPVTRLLDPDVIRPALDVIKKEWEALLAGRPGFYLEDKGWSLAIHGRYASKEEASAVIDQAREIAHNVQDLDAFFLLGGHKFFEISPVQAGKGKALAYLLEIDPWPAACPIYIGDDDKDEQAFQVVNQRGGITIVVAELPRPTEASYRLASPSAVRIYLNTLLEIIN